MRKLPYRVRTQSGDAFDVEFPLHPETGDPVRVAQLLALILDNLDRDLGLGGETSNGDVLQALAMAMAVRAEIIYAPREITHQMARDLLQSALSGMAASVKHEAPSGHA